MQKTTWPWWLVLVLASGWCAVTATAADDLQRLLPRYLEDHCVECHGGKKPEAGLALGKLPLRFDEPALMSAWTRVYDQLRSGDMPPKDHQAPRPPAAETDAIAAWLEGRLAASSLARQQSDGRAAVRRLNRVEYEYTLSDLLGVPLHLTDLLPEDGQVGGFDTVAGGLDISATHLVRYQLAADRALDAALPGVPPVMLNESVSGRQWFERVHPNIKRFAGRSYVLEGEVGVLYQYDTLTDTDLLTRQTPVSPGLYRLRLTVAARNTGGRPLPLRLVWRDVRADAKLTHLIGYRDAPPGKPTTIELVIDVPPARADRNNIAIQAFTLPEIPRHDGKEHPAPDHATAPALEIHRYDLEGPLSGWPSPAYRTLFGDLPCVPRSLAGAVAEGRPVGDEWLRWDRHRLRGDRLVPVSRAPQADAERLVRGFLAKAVRRPVDEALARTYVGFAHERLARGVEFGEAMRATYRAILCSPHVLFLLGRPGPLDDHALAERLSYFLWSSAPDAELSAAAEAKRLRQPAVLRAQVERLLNDARSERFVRRFTDQWLGVQKALAMKPDEVYQEYDDHLGAALAPETRLFVAELLVKDLSVRNVIDSDWTFVNERLARHYGIADVHGYEFRKVALKPEHHRGGVLTHASVLKASANGTYTSPIIRGVWLLEQIVGQPPSPDVEAVQPDIRGATTLRQQIEQHRALPACASCHAKIDPPGFALESYDVIGGWRTRYRTPQPGEGVKADLENLTNYPHLKKVWLVAPVDPSAVTASGKAFADLAGYKRILLEDPDQIARTLARKLLTYATGCDQQFADRAELARVVAAVRPTDHGLRSLIHALVQSRPFLNQ